MDEGMINICLYAKIFCKVQIVLENFFYGTHSYRCVGKNFRYGMNFLFLCLEIFFKGTNCIQHFWSTV